MLPSEQYREKILNVFENPDFFVDDCISFASMHENFHVKQSCDVLSAKKTKFGVAFGVRFVSFSQAKMFNILAQNLHVGFGCD